MTDQSDTRSVYRRKRVRLLKRLIIISLITSILIPIVLCILLLARVNSLEKELRQIKDMVAAVQMQESTEGAAQAQESAEGAAQVQESEESAGEKENSLQTAPLTGGDGKEGTEDDGIIRTATEDNTGHDVTEDILSDSKEQTHKVYLTFDDGPSSNTDRILDILAEYDVKATFFVVGKEGEWAEKAYTRIVDEGHTLGMHSYTHQYDTIYASVDAYAEDLGRLQEYLYRVTGISPQFVRFPGGSSNTVSRTDMKEFIAYLNEEGFVYFDWNVSSQDAVAGGISAEEILKNCEDGLKKHDNAVILMHDAAGRNTTVEALPALIEAILAMENTELLPITEDTVPVQHITISQEETEE